MKKKLSTQIDPECNAAYYRAMLLARELEIKELKREIEQQKQAIARGYLAVQEEEAYKEQTNTAKKPKKKAL